MKQLTLVIPEDMYVQLVVAAETAGPTVEPKAAASLRPGLPLPYSRARSPSSLSAALASLQTPGITAIISGW